ncbi:sigma-70 family RNA polymerase sigma factor [Phenylobacterium sp.]|uniref:sigma-70 family RNA polymerase sigma factor n=1 Tax=Phenylobacterium sp. TaxID=1871053 RepID=UPI002731CB84|nr:sigma-70 family RNA polymerase sigma factor [Phenylobacterium sp.]MDP1597794.1 sigma-70 family RNA polymerase sigma factor [Phenylobacterium sp.]MDP3590750.1 sigma-70 family RNA polymerase sigma factor [Phenylobacterium sp.]MDP3592090.1 sigma-70 family RNA polymerase sigma factor [Phenylobacterium sp.]
MDIQTLADDAFKTELTGLIPQMRAFARSLCRDAVAADDLAQDALLKAWNNRSSYQAGTNMKAWTFMILRNQFYSDKRRSWRSTQLDPEVAERTLVAVSNPIASLELDEVRRALAKLPEDQREALILIGAGGLSYEEVSEICGCAIGTIKSRVSRARDRLAALLEDGAYDQDDMLPSNAMGNLIAQLDSLRGAAIAA